MVSASVSEAMINLKYSIHRNNLLWESRNLLSRLFLIQEFQQLLKNNTWKSLHRKHYLFSWKVLSGNQNLIKNSSSYILAINVSLKKQN